MTNPYDAPSVQTSKDNSGRWVVISAILFILLVIVGGMLYRALVVAEQARAEAQQLKLETEQAWHEARQKELELARRTQNEP